MTLSASLANDNSTYLAKIIKLCVDSHMHNVFIIKMFDKNTEKLLIHKLQLNTEIALTIYNTYLNW